MRVRVYKYTQTHTHTGERERERERERGQYSHWAVLERGATFLAHAHVPAGIEQPAGMASKQTEKKLVSAQTIPVS